MEWANRENEVAPWVLRCLRYLGVQGGVGGMCRLWRWIWLAKRKNGRLDDLKGSCYIEIRRIIVNLFDLR